MSVLTKVFVVLVTFLSILLVALIVPFVAKTQDYQELLTEARAATRTAQVAARAKQSEIAEIQAKQTQNLTQLQTQLQSQARQLDTALDQLTEARTQIEGLKADSVKSQASMSRLTATVNQLGQVNESLSGEVKEYRERAVKAERNSIELADTIDEVTNQRDTLARQDRRKSEQLAERESEIKSLQAAIQRLDEPTRQRILGGEASSMADANTTIVPEVPIAGQVTSVAPIGGDTFIEIDVGVNDGVERNMKFWIFRGDQQFIGTAVVEKVDVSAAAARVNLIIEGSDVVKGDSVLTGGPGL